MTSTFAGLSIADPNVTWLDPGASNIKKTDGSDDIAFQKFVDDQNRFLTAKYTQPIDISNDPTYKPYATVTVGGQTVATIDNHGYVTTSNALGSKMRALLSGSEEGLTGPALAQARAEKIAALVGGKAEKMSTALTQSQFAAVPSVQPTVNYDALRQDPAYAKLQQTIQAHTAFLAQKMAGETEQTTVATQSVGMASAGTGTDGAGKAETTSDVPPGSFSYSRGGRFRRPRGLPRLYEKDPGGTLLRSPAGRRGPDQGRVRRPPAG